MSPIPKTNIAVVIASTVLWTSFMPVHADDWSERKAMATSETPCDDDEDQSSPAVPATPAPPADIVIQTIEPDAKTKRGKEVAWMGVATDEASETLSAQLGLKPGEGLTITLLASGSPAAKADLRKNDVLVDFDGQMLVHPMQLRKLVQMHAEGDAIKVTFYRGGKKQTASVKLSKTTWDEASDMDQGHSPGDLQIQLNNLQRLSGDMRGMKESLALAGLDKTKINLEVKRTMEQTRKALQDALRQAESSDRSLESANRELERLARRGVDVDNDATVIVRNKHDSKRTMVETDDAGTYVIEAGAKTHLTARDKHGKLLFEGEVDTPAQQAKVPKEVWEKAKSMIDQIAIPSPNEGKPDDKSVEKPNSRNKTHPAVSYERA